MKTPSVVPLIVLLAAGLLAQTPTLPDGYDSVVFYQVSSGPQLTAIAHDATGAAYVADVTGVIRRLEDTTGDLVADTVIQAWPGLGFTPAVVGMVFLNGSLFVSDRGSIWELRDTDNDHVFDVQTLVVSGLPVAFHQNNALFTDGTWLYFGQGSLTDHAMDPGPVATLRRIKPDGTGLEVYAEGIRNLFDGVVHPSGDIYVGDNGPNAVAANPSPADELIRVQQGGHYGHPFNWGTPPVGGPYLAPHLLLPAHTAPTGLAVNDATAHSGFENELFLASFAGGIARVPVVVGSVTGLPGSWLEPFVGNVPQVIDIEQRPQDGHLFAVQYNPRTVLRIFQTHSTVLAVTGQPSVGMTCPLEVRDPARAGQPFLVAASHRLTTPLSVAAGVDVFLDTSSPLFVLSVTPGNGIFNFPVPGLLDGNGVGSVSISLPNDPILVGLELQLQAVVLAGPLTPEATTPPLRFLIQVAF